MTNGIDAPREHQEKARTNYQDILSKPALSKNEDAAEFFKLEEALRAEMKPQTLFQEIELRDLANKVWDGQRLRRMQRALIESHGLQSLIGLLAHRYGENHEQAIQDAQDYFSADTKKAQRVEKSLAAMGITADHIEANAMHLSSSSLNFMDGMISRGETARNSIIRGRERREQKAAKSLRRKRVSNGHAIGGPEPEGSTPKPSDRGS